MRPLSTTRVHDDAAIDTGQGSVMREEGESKYRRVGEVKLSRPDRLIPQSPPFIMYLSIR